MAVHDAEDEDELTPQDAEEMRRNQEWFDAQQELVAFDREEEAAKDTLAYEQAITVRFEVAGDTVKGRVIQDVRGKSRSKIVFLARSWVGPKPKHDEEFSVRVVHETKDHDPRSGVLFVERVLKRLTRRHWHGGMTAKCPSCSGRIPVLHERTRKVLPDVTCAKCGTAYSTCFNS